MLEMCESAAAAAAAWLAVVCAASLSMLALRADAITYFGSSSSGHGCHA